MNKKDFVDKISETTNMTKKDVGLVLDTFFDLISCSLAKEEKVTITNFGSFEVNKPKPLDVFSPYDGKLMKGVKQVRVHFKSSDALKEKIKDE